MIRIRIVDRRVVLSFIVCHFGLIVSFRNLSNIITIINKSCDWVYCELNVLSKLWTHEE